jgi:hypothetical protein
MICAINQPDVVSKSISPWNARRRNGVRELHRRRAVRLRRRLHAILLVMVALAERSGKYKTSHFAVMTGVWNPRHDGGRKRIPAGSRTARYTGLLWYVIACRFDFLVRVRRVCGLIRPISAGISAVRNDGRRDWQFRSCTDYP